MPSPSRLSPDEFAHRRLINQGIGQRRFSRVDEAVCWLGAVQAQDYAGASWSLGLRVPGATADDVERAFAGGAILRTHLLRPTWHFVHPDDIGWLLTLTAPRVQALNAHSYRTLDLDARTLRRSLTVMEKALQGRHLTRAEVGEALERAGIRAAGTLRLSYLMMNAELNGVVCSGPRRQKQFTYALLSERAPRRQSMTRDEALAALALRYATSRGPATAIDFAKWSGLTRADSERGLDAAGSALRREEVEGKTYWLPARSAAGRPTRVPACLLSIYDEYVSGYKAHGTIADPGVGARLRALGNALTAIVVVDGRIAGTWRRTAKGTSIAVAFTLFRRLTAAEREAVARAVDAFGTFWRTRVVVSGLPS